jgi:hypothetical protein
MAPTGSEASTAWLHRLAGVGHINIRSELGLNRLRCVGSVRDPTPEHGDGSGPVSARHAGPRTTRFGALKSPMPHSIL